MTFTGRRALVGVTLLVLPLAPGLLLVPLGLQAAMGTFMFGTFTGAIVSAFTRVRLGLIVVGALGVASLLAVPAAPYVLPAALVMGVSALLYGLTARWGISSIIVMAPELIAFTLAEPPQVHRESVWVNAVAVGLVTLASGLWGVALGALVAKRVPHKPPQSESMSTAVTFAVTMAIVTGATMAVVVAMQLQHGGAWLVLTLLLVIQPHVHQTWRKTIERSLGTVLGFAIALAAALVVQQESLSIVLALLFIGAAVFVYLDPKRPYWQFVMFLTPGIVLVEGAGENVISTDVARLWFTLLGAAIALVVVAVFHWLGEWTASRRS